MTCRWQVVFGKRGHAYRPQQCLYFLPLPQGQGSLRPTLGPVRTGLAFSATAAAASLTTSLALACAPPELAVLVPPKALAAWWRVCCGTFFRKFSNASMLDALRKMLWQISVFTLIIRSSKILNASALYS